MRYILLTLALMLSPACSYRQPETETTKASSPSLHSPVSISDVLNEFNSASPCSVVDRTLSNLDWDDLDRLQRRKVEAVQAICSLPSDGITKESAEKILDSATLAAQITGDELLVFMVSDSGQEPRLCCAIQRANWKMLGENIYVTRFRLNRASEAMLSFFTFGSSGSTDGKVSVRGTNAPPAPKISDDSMLNIRGKLVEATLSSPQLGETRHIHVYLPPGHSSDREWPVLVVADGTGAGLYPRFLERMMLSGEMAPTILVGLPSGKAGIVNPSEELTYDVRAADYLPGLALEMGWTRAEDRFDQHLEFVTETVLPWAQSEFSATSDRNKIAVVGHSNGGVFAMYAALRRPDVFAASISMSPGYGSLEQAPEQSEWRARFFFSAGLYEGAHFGTSAMDSADILLQAGYEVDIYQPAAGHGPDHWDHQVARTAPQVFSVGSD